MYDEPLSDLLAASLTRLQTEMQRVAPFMAQQVSGWIGQLSGTHRPEDYFKHPASFPLLLFPWWLEKTLRPQPDLAFHADLVYSTMNGYYYFRLLDNLMDGHGSQEIKILPAASFFHLQSQSVYQRYFEPDHPFWDFFARVLFGSAESTMQDAGLDELTLTQFQAVTSHKVCGGKLPVGAICYRYDCPHLIEPWSRFFDAFGAWHQMRNDVLDWNKDLTHHTCTYFLSEANRRRRADEPVAAWVAREGFQWGSDILGAWLADLKTLAASLHSPDLEAYLAEREAMMMKQTGDVLAGLRSLEAMAQVLKVNS